MSKKVGNKLTWCIMAAVFCSWTNYLSVTYHSSDDARILHPTTTWFSFLHTSLIIPSSTTWLRSLESFGSIYGINNCECMATTEDHIPTVFTLPSFSYI